MTPRTDPFTYSNGKRVPLRIQVRAYQLVDDYGWSIDGALAKAEREDAAKRANATNDRSEP